MAHPQPPRPPAPAPAPLAPVEVTQSLIEFLNLGSEPISLTEVDEAIKSGAAPPAACASPAPVVMVPQGGVPGSGGGGGVAPRQSAKAKAKNKTVKTVSKKKKKKGKKKKVDLGAAGNKAGGKKEKQKKRRRGDSGPGVDLSTMTRQPSSKRTKRCVDQRQDIKCGGCGRSIKVKSDNVEQKLMLPPAGHTPRSEHMFLMRCAKCARKHLKCHGNACPCLGSDCAAVLAEADVSRWKPSKGRRSSAGSGPKVAASGGGGGALALAPIEVNLAPVVPEAGPFLPRSMTPTVASLYGGGGFPFMDPSCPQSAPPMASAAASAQTLGSFLFSHAGAKDVTFETTGTSWTGGADGTGGTTWTDGTGRTTGAFGVLSDFPASVPPPPPHEFDGATGPDGADGADGADLANSILDGAFANFDLVSFLESGL